MNHRLSSPSGTSLQSFSDPRYINEKFTPGRWLERRQIDVPSCTVVSGSYKRENPVVGGFQTEDVHFFDFSLAGRPEDAKGYLVDFFKIPQPLGEINFIPAGHRYVGGSGWGTQNNLFVFLNARALREEDEPMAEVLPSPALQSFMNLHSNRIRFLLTQINRELYNPGFASELMVEGLAITLLAETTRLLKQAESTFTVRGGLSPSALRKIKDRALDGGKPPSLLELATMCNLSRRHLTRAFRESTGQTIGQFIQQIAMNRAAYLLRETDQPVAIIAQELGFATTSAFSTAFRRFTGESPREFRHCEPTRAVRCQAALRGPGHHLTR